MIDPNEFGDMFPGKYRLVFGRPPGPGARVYALDAGVVIGVEEERDGVPVPIQPIDDAVGRCPIDIIGPPRHQLSQVHD